MSVKLAVFDMAGTTVTDDNYVARAFQNAFRNNGQSVTEKEVNPLMGYHKPVAIKMVLEKQGVAFDAELIDKIHENFVDEMLDFYEYAAEVKPMAGAEDIFLFLKERGVLVALNTGFPRIIATTIVKRFQWMERGLIDEYIASDEVEKGRPFSYMIYELKRRLGVTENDIVIKVGDTVVDIEEGKNAGCDYIIAVTTGAASAEELEDWNPTHIISRLSQIPVILKPAFSLYA